MQYYATRLSENISRREPEGYLFCLNVPVARTGIQEYMPEELGLPPGAEPVAVFRPEEEVFAPETVASFEGMPVTNDHPPDNVSVSNIRACQKGHAHNVRRGAGNESDLLLADLIITDPALIDAILSGKREISCGYTYRLHEENGQFIQRTIRGNHVAVVDTGRAGPRVSIRDRKPPRLRSLSIPKHERRKRPMKKSLLKKLTVMAHDGDQEAIEALAEAAGEMIETPSAGSGPAAFAIAAETGPGAPVAAAGNVPAGEAAGETSAEADPDAESPSAADSEAFTAILERLDRLIALLTSAEAAKSRDVADLPEELAEIVGEAVEAAGPDDTEGNAEEIAAIFSDILDPDVSTVLEPEEEESDGDCPDPRGTGDALRIALEEFRPVMKRMPYRERSRVCANIARRMQNTCTDSRAYTALSAVSARRSEDPADLGRKIMASRNPNYRG